MKVIIVEVTRAANSFGRTHLAEIRRAYDSIAKIVADGQESGQFRRDIDSTFASMYFYGAIEQLLSGWIFGLIPAADADFDQARSLARGDDLRRPRAAIGKVGPHGERDRQASRLERHARRLRRPRQHSRQPRRRLRLPPPLRRGAARVAWPTSRRHTSVAGRDRSVSELVFDVAEKGSSLVREEIELAKTEISEKVGSLLRGSASGSPPASSPSSP